MVDAARLLAAYDNQLRGDAETRGALEVERVGPAWVATFAQGRGFVSYRSLPDDGAAVRRVVADVVRYLEGRGDVVEAEWKTRAHDRAPGLHAALVDHGFVAEEPESIMVGEARALAVDVPLPDGVTLRRITSEADVRAMSAMADEVFGDPVSERRALDLLQRQADDPSMEMWVAEAGGEIVTAGRLEPVAGTEFAGLWGGASRPRWRRQGIYRALTAARARSAMRLGKRYVNSDSTAYSRPILERSGLVKVSETTPWVLRLRAG